MQQQNSNGNDICEVDVSSSEFYWVCSLDQHHLGDHKAYTSHIIRPRNLRHTWPGDLPEVLIIEEWP